jgi:hypothetical protein
MDRTTEQRRYHAVITLAIHKARRIVQDQIRARGEKVSHYAAKDITLLAEQYLNEHRHELIREAWVRVQAMTAEGFFGKRAQRDCANLSSDAQTAKPHKSTTSTVQMLGAE